MNALYADLQVIYQAQGGGLSVGARRKSHQDKTKQGLGARGVRVIFLHLSR
jgi:hypothetical protein